MDVFRDPRDIPAHYGPTVASIGNFDGVHAGHRVVLKELQTRAAAMGARSMAVTFAPHPLRLLRPETCPRLITPLETRLELLGETGVDAALVLPFTPELACMPARAFATNILRDALHAIEIHEGPNFRFGYRAEGGITELRALGDELGFSVIIQEACRVRGLVVSSSRIRELIAGGRLSMARALLGHGFFIDGTPASGRGIGSTLTVPTINLAPYSELLPAHGVYVTQLRIAGEWFDAVTNVGNRPTFGEDSFAVESHLLDFRPIPLEDETPLRLCFYYRLREERRWPSPEALKAQIMRDVRGARRYLRRSRLERGAVSQR